VPDSLPVSDIQIERDSGDMLGLIGGRIGKALFSERLTLDGLMALWHPE
jgi:hypothetical protein